MKTNEDMFCFTYTDPLEASIERKKIERGIQVVVKWPHNKEAPTITYEMRCDHFGTVTYRVKYNETVWANFENTTADAVLVKAFRKALLEIAAAQYANEHEDRQATQDENNKAAANFFRAEVRAV